MEKKKCTGCHHDRPLKEFWKSNNMELYPIDGKVDLCRSCLTKGIEDLEDWRGVREVCKVMDFPYVDRVWKGVVEKLKASNRCDLSSEPKKRESIRKAMGDYSRLMKLVAYKKKRYIDSDAIVTLIDNAADEKKKLEQEIENEELRMVIDASHISLSVEDRSFLMQKWDTGDLNDIMYLEDYYLGMMDDYEITTTAHKDYLKKIALVSLRLNKAIKTDDWEALKVLRQAYSSWMKEADFTAQQNNKDKSDFASCFGEIAAFLETKGFIDTINLDFPRDIVDRTIGNLNSYTRDLVLSENGLGDLLESTIALMNKPDEDEEEDYVHGDEDIWKDELDIDWSEEEIEDKDDEDE